MVRFSLINLKNIYDEWNNMNEVSFSKIGKWPTSICNHDISKYIRNTVGILNKSKNFHLYYNNKESSTWIFSLKVQYVKYCMYEINKNVDLNYLKKKLKFVLLFIVNTVAKLATVDECIYINHNLCSTTIWCDSPVDIFNTEKNFWGNIPIVFRSLTKKQVIDFEAAKIKNFVILYFREAMFLDCNSAIYSKKHQKNIDKDFSLINKNGYTIINKDFLERDDYSRLVELYNMLYIDKYVTMNPLYTTLFFENILTDDSYNIICLKKDNLIDAFGLIEIKNNSMQMPCIGYDTSLEMQGSLYRQITSAVIKFSLKNKINFYMSDGCFEFKKSRGGVPYSEYIGVYIGNVSYFKKIYWKIFAILINKFWRKSVAKYFFGVEAGLFE